MIIVNLIHFADLLENEPTNIISITSRGKPMQLENLSYVEVEEYLKQVKAAAKSR